VAREHVERRLGDLVDAGAVGGLVAAQHHVRLQQRPVEVDPLVVQLGVDRLERAPVALAAPAIECVPSISTSGSTIGTSPASWESAA
jgi:hypothetical protein